MIRRWFKAVDLAEVFGVGLHIRGIGRRFAASILVKLRYKFNECWAEQKQKCLGECMVLCVRHRYACIPTDVHM